MKRLIFAGLTFFALRASAAELATKRPNIVLFFPDQHRYDWTSMNPALPAITPNLQKLAQEGVFFSKAFCPSPVCAPSRACLALGRKYERCGVSENGDSLSLSETTFYKLLRDSAGYHVLGCGKFDLDKPGNSWGIDGKHPREGKPSMLEVWGFSDGIDNAGKVDGSRAAKANVPEPYYAYLKSLNLLRKDVTDESYSDNWIARNGLMLIRSVPKGEPWLLQINFNGPHSPFDPTKTMLQKWETTDFPPAVCGQGDNGGDRRRYAAEIYNIDSWIAVYREELKRRGELENTIILYCSDHGEMLGDHGYTDKGRPLSASACVPLVIAGPGIKRNQVCSNAVETLDLTATILDFAGVPVPAGMDSKSMRPYLEGTGNYPRKFVTSALDGWSLVCDGRYKLIAGSLAGKVQAKDQDKAMVLYDLQLDPAETVDVFSEHPDIVAKLKPLLPPVADKAGKGRKSGKNDQ